MHQVDRERLLADMHSDDDSMAVEAAKGLLQLGEYGTPTGTYLLAGGKAALRIRRLADAVVLTYNGLEVSTPNTETWAELLVNRAVACARHGFDSDAISAGERFLSCVGAFPQFAKWVPYAHHAIGYAHDRLGQYDQAAHHFRLASELATDPVEGIIATCNLSSALANSGNASEALVVLREVQTVEDTYAMFVLQGTTVMVCHLLGQFAEAKAAGERAEALAVGKEEAWAISQAEIRFWLSQTLWELGDRYRSAALAYFAAVAASEKKHFRLARLANEWLATIMERGGIQIG